MLEDPNENDETAEETADTPVTETTAEGRATVSSRTTIPFTAATPFNKIFLMHEILAHDWPMPVLNYLEVYQGTTLAGRMYTPPTTFRYTIPLRADFPRDDPNMRILLDRVKRGGVSVNPVLDHRNVEIVHLPHYYRDWMNRVDPIRYGLILDMLQGTDAIANQKRRRIVTKWAQRETGEGFHTRVFGARPQTVGTPPVTLGPGEILLALCMSTLIAAGESANLEDDDIWESIKTNAQVSGPHIVEYADAAQWLPHIRNMRAGTTFKIAKLGTRENGQIYYYPADPETGAVPTMNRNHTRWANRILDRDIERAPYPYPVWETVAQR